MNPATQAPDALRDALVGRAREELATPALLLDFATARANIDAMATRMRELPTELRPHIKVHKSPELARMQVEAGAIGVTCATVWEAVAMADEGGVEDVLVGNELVGELHMRAAAELAGRARVTVAADDAGNVERLGAAAQAAGTVLGVLVEVDVGMGRCGVRDADAARRLAAVTAATAGLELRGLMGYEGHCMLEPDEPTRRRKQRQAMDDLAEVVEAVRADGLPVPIVSAGGTGTFHLTGADSRVTEVQAGSYVLMDAFHTALMPDFPVALSVLASVLSRQDDRIVLDAGVKALGHVAPQLDGAAPLYVNEEHSAFASDGRAERVGDTVAVTPGYAPTAANLYDAYLVMEDGVVRDVWPLRARYGTRTAIGATGGSA